MRLSTNNQLSSSFQNKSVDFFYTSYLRCTLDAVYLLISCLYRIACTVYFRSKDSLGVTDHVQVDAFRLCAALLGLVVERARLAFGLNLLTVVCTDDATSHGTQNG